MGAQRDQNQKFKVAIMRSKSRVLTRNKTQNNSKELLNNRGGGDSETEGGHQDNQADQKVTDTSPISLH